ncbi:MAG: M81 family metallopeptidase, partial [bacterium]|nr:M81 family metallopeptidase [bacterium]
MRIKNTTNSIRIKMSRMKCMFICILPLILIFFIAGCQGTGEETFKIAVATFSHETCTFNPDPTTVEDWEYYGPPTRDIVDTDRGYIGGFVTFCNDFGNVDLVGITSPRNARGGSSGSWNTLEAFDKYAGLIVKDIEELGPFDGVFLALHGAMAVTGIPKPEAELVRRIREVVGPDVPIMVTLDLHANEDRELSDAADAVFIIKRYPHYDTTLQGARCASVMLKTLRGMYNPTMTTLKPNVITPSVYQGTGVTPAMDIMERARRWENQRKDAYV